MGAPSPRLHAPLSTGLHWVRVELEQSLSRARQLIEQYAESPDDPLPLQQAVTELHQARGTASMIQCYGAAALADEMKQTLLDLLQPGAIAEPELAYSGLMSAAVQLSDYIEALAVGFSDCALVLQPVINELRLVRGKPVVTEADLFVAQMGELALMPQAPDLQQSAAVDAQPQARRLSATFQAALLQWLRNADAAPNLGRIGKIAEMVGEQAHDASIYQLWRAVAACVEALLTHRLEDSLDLKRLFGRAGQQLKQLADSGEAAAAPMARELVYALLFFVGRSRGSGPRVTALRKAYQLSVYLPPSGVLDDLRRRLRGPGTQLLDRVAAEIRADLAQIKDAIDLVVRAGPQVSADLAPVRERLTRVSNTLSVLGLPVLQRVIANQARVLESLQPDDASARQTWMDFATAVLRVEHSLEDALFRQLKLPDLATGVMPAALAELNEEVPHASDLREGIDALLRESLVNLAKLKAYVDTFIRSGDSTGLAEGGRLLNEIASGFRILDRDRAAQLIDQLKAFLLSPAFLTLPQQPSLAERFADVVAGVEFFIEAQRDKLPMADRLLDDLASFVERLDPADEAPSLLLPSMLPEPEPVAEIALPEALEGERPAAAALQAPDAPATPETGIAEPAPSAAAPASVPDEVDPEIRDIFLEEAAEVLQTLQRAVPRWSRAPGDHDTLIDIRRAFHTLKGSGRMVGADDIGEFGWSLELLLNRCLDGTVEAGPRVVDAVRSAVQMLPRLIEAYRDGAVPQPDFKPLCELAQALAASRDAAGEPDIVAVFRGDAQERLRLVAQWLDGLDRRDAEFEVSPDVVRAFHTLRGAARVVGAAHIGDVAERLETYLDAIRGAGLGLSGDGLQLLDDALASLRDWAEQVGTSGDVAPDARPLLERIERIQSVVPETAVHAVADRQLADIFAGEAFELVQKIEEIAVSWYRAPDARFHAHDLKTVLHTLRGAAYMSHCTPLGDAARALHDRMDGFAEGPPPSRRFFEAFASLAEHWYQVLDQYRDGALGGDSTHLVAEVMALDPQAPDAPAVADAPASDDIEALLDAVMTADAGPTPETSAEPASELSPAEPPPAAAELQAAAAGSELEPLLEPEPELEPEPGAEPWPEPAFDAPAEPTIEAQTGVDARPETEPPAEPEMELLWSDSALDRGLADHAPAAGFGEPAPFQPAPEAPPESLPERQSEPQLESLLDAPLEPQPEPPPAAPPEPAWSSAMPAELLELPPSRLAEPAGFIELELPPSQAGDSAPPQGESFFDGPLELELDLSSFDQAQDDDAGEAIELSLAPTAAPPPPDEPEAPPFELDLPESMLQDVFLGEAAELLREIDRHADALEATPGDLSIAAQLRLNLHSLKGDAHVAGLPALAEVAQRLEVRTFAVASGQAPADTYFFAGLHNSIDGMLAMLDQMSRGEVPDAGALLAEPEDPDLALELPPPTEGLAVAEFDEPDQASYGEAAAAPARTLETSSPAIDLSSFDSSLLDAPEPEPVFEAPALEPAAAASAAAESLIDRELADIFSAESAELLETLDALLKAWRQRPDDDHALRDIQRALHTLKGGARMAGLSVMGSAAHDMETRVHAIEIGRVAADENAHARLAGDLESLQLMHDLLARGDVASLMEPAEAAAPAPVLFAEVVEPRPAPAAASSATAVAWDPQLFWKPEEDSGAGSLRRETARVAVESLDGMLNQAGEISIYRSRLEEHNASLQGALVEMTQTIARLREQLRQLDIETEAQVAARGLTRAAPQQDRYSGEFDPLEMDRYSRMQELSRALAESVGDLASLHTSMDEVVGESDTLLQQQGRINTEVQTGLMGTLMVPFSRQVQRLQRVVRQVAAENGKQVEVQFSGIESELDRNVLERMTAPLEHLLRNSVVHGIETPEARVAAGKPPAGTIGVSLRREGTQLLIELRDDGGGLDIDAIRTHAIRRGLMPDGAQLPDEDIAQFIFSPGFSTARTLTQDAGRGVGMDVVASEVKQLGGTLELGSEAGRGIRFQIRLPLTLAVSQALLVKVGDEQYAIPLPAIEGIARIPRDNLGAYYSDGGAPFAYGGHDYRVRYLGEYLGLTRQPEIEQKSVSAILVRVGEGLAGGDRRVAIVVDKLVGNREIISKSVGPQVSSIVGLSGATILADGQVVLILDIAALAQDRARRALLTQAARAVSNAPDERDMVMVVDDSITMRRVAERLLLRNGFRVSTAKDGLDAMARLQTETPVAVLLDIEMPRADGFEVAAFIRNTPRLSRTPIVMITSRSGDKHRERARSLGVDRYLIKPYQEDQLMSEVRALVAEAGALRT